MYFRNIIGQKELGHKMRESIRVGRIPHAQLFLGAEGSGNLALALAYARYVMCLQPSDDDSCGDCSSCRKLNNLAHPDVHYSFPFPSNQADVASELYPKWREFAGNNPYMTYEQWMTGLDAENKQGNIPVKECQAIIRSLALKPFESEFKVLIMWLPEFLGNQGNVLLKLIEEPAHKTLFLLVGENTDKILTTILSRAQLVRIPPVDAESISAALQTELSFSREDAHRIALMSSGNWVKALELAANSENKFLEPLRTWLLLCYGKKLAPATKWSEDYASNGRETLKGFFIYALEILRAVTVYSVTQKLDGLNESEADFVTKFSKVLNKHEKFESMYNHFNDAVYQIERNANAKLVLTDMSFKLIRLFAL